MSTGLVASVCETLTCVVSHFFFLFLSFFLRGDNVTVGARVDHMRD